MKRLLLLRHAKAVPAGGKSGDYGRALNARGHADAPRMGVAMQHRAYLPDLVLCSTATRTAQTWEHVASELAVDPEVRMMDELYLAPWKTIADIVRGVRGTPDVVLVIGHNPGLEEFARALARKPIADVERALLDSLMVKYPTATLAAFALDIAQWSELALAAGTLIDFVRPKDLTPD